MTSVSISYNLLTKDSELAALSQRWVYFLELHTDEVLLLQLNKASCVDR